VVLNLVDRDAASHPVFRVRLDALGYGFLIPVFFVSSGVGFDLGALTRSPSALARVPLFLLALLVVRGAPAVLYARAQSAGAARSPPGSCKPPHCPSSSPRRPLESRSGSSCP
jgi:sodium/hydrogen exchanger family protein